MNKKQSEIPDYIIHLISILDTKKRLSPDQHSLLHEWLNESLENWQLLEELMDIWNNSRVQKPPALSEDVVSEMMNKIERHEALPTHEIEIDTLFHKHNKKSFSGRSKFVQSRRESWAIRMIRVAAIIVLTIGIFWLQQKSGSDNKKQTPLQNQIFTTENAQQTKIRLPDGSFVHLNAASQLQIPPTFAQGSRKIYLNGEAYFKVAHDSLPFIVETDLGEIEDIGTAFNIRIRENSLHVIVTDGKIVFSLATDTKQVAKQHQQPQDKFRLHVSAGQMAGCTLKGQLEMPHAVDVKRFIAWRNNKLIFEKVPLVNVFKELKRCYDLEFQIRTDIDKRSLTAQFNNLTVEQMLEKLSLITGLRFERDRRVVRVLENN